MSHEQNWLAGWDWQCGIEWDYICCCLNNEFYKRWVKAIIVIIACLFAF
jgi:hypothetical protein